MPKNWKRVEPGMYLHSSGATVYKLTTTKHSTIAGKFRDRATSCTFDHWGYCLTGQKGSGGYASMREAIETAERDMDRRK